MKNEWSPTAGVIGFFIAVAMALATDFSDTYSVRIIVGGLMLVVQVVRLFRLTVSFDPGFWVMVPLVLIGALANAAWYMILCETMRLLVKKLYPR